MKDKALKSGARRGKRKYMDNITKEAEATAERSNNKTLHELHKLTPAGGPVKDKQDLNNRKKTKRVIELFQESCEGPHPYPIKEEVNELFWAWPALTRCTCNTCSAWREEALKKPATRRGSN